MVPSYSLEPLPDTRRWAQAVARAPHAALLTDLHAVSALFPPDWRAVRALEHVLMPDLDTRASYVLASVDDPERQTLGALHESADGSGLRARLLADDPDLRPALDPARVAPRLAEALGHRVAGCRATALRWRPGDRCVVRYEIETSDRPVYGKALATGADALASLLDALGHAADAPGLPRTPRLLGAWPDWSFVLTAEVRGEDLGQFAVGGAPGDVRQRLRAAGRSVAAFHDAVAHPAPRQPREADLGDLSRLAGAVSLLAPEVGDRYAELVGRLHAAETAAVPSIPVPSHGALRPSHMRMDGDSVGLVDLDGFCLAEPERDVGELLAYLRWRSAKRPTDLEPVAEAIGLVLAGYGDIRSLDLDRLRHRRAVSLTRLVGRRFAALDVRRWSAAEALLDDVDALLDGELDIA